MPFGSISLARLDHRPLAGGLRLVCEPGSRCRQHSLLVRSVWLACDLSWPERQVLVQVLMFSLLFCSCCWAPSLLSVPFRAEHEAAARGIFFSEASSAHFRPFGRPMVWAHGKFNMDRPSALGCRGIDWPVYIVLQVGSVHKTLYNVGH